MNAEKVQLKPGDAFGDYKVERLLGMGGMGAVYLVRASDGRRYALKVMKTVLGDKGSDFRKRFLREGEFARNIRHPNLIAVYEVRVDLSSGLNYIVMEYAPGGSIRDRLIEKGKFDIAEAVEIIRQVAYGLAAAHQHGVVHRDIKPDNILFAADGTPKLTDLGVAKFTEDQQTTAMTSAGEVIGTPAYMAPEQIMNAHKVDSRADIYALGVVFYEMLAGKCPNESDTFLQLLAKAVKGIPLPSVRKMRPEVSASLVQVLNVMCAIRADDRFDSSQKLIDVFERLKREGLDVCLGLRQPPNRRRRTLMTISFLLGVSILGVGAIAYDRMATFVEHYGDWVDEWGVPEGRIPLDARSAEMRDHFTFEYRGRSSVFGKRVLRRVTQRDHFGLFKCTKDLMSGRRPEIMDISYDEDGRLSYIDHVKPGGRIELRCLYSGTGRRYIDFKVPERDGGMIAAYIHGDSGAAEEHDDEDRDVLALCDADISRIRRHAITRDEHGYISRIDFMVGDANEPTADANGFFAVLFDRDEFGRPVLVHWVDENGNPTVNMKGVASVKRTYDENGNIQADTWLDISTNTVSSSDGYARRAYAYDNLGRCVEESYIGTDGKPCMAISWQMASKRMIYGANRMQVQYMGLDNRPIYQRNFVAGQELRLVSSRHTQEVWIDADGKACVCKDGYARIDFLRDQHGREIKCSFYDERNCPVKSTGGYHARCRAYDESGNLVEEWFQDVEGRLCRNVKNIARVRMAYDRSGRQTKMQFFDEVSKPCMGSWGYAETHFKYDTHGNPVLLSFYDVSGNPCVSRVGAASILQQFDSQGRLRRQECLAPDGKAMKSVRTAIYVCPSCFRINGMHEHCPLTWCFLPVGVASVQLEYSKRGRITEIRFYDETGALQTNKDGVAVSKFGYDRNGFQTTCDYYDDNGRRTGDCVRYENDARGNRVLIEFIGTNGCPAISTKSGCAMVRKRYDYADNPLESSFYDETGSPMLSAPSVLPSRATGMFKIKHRRDDCKGMRENWYYGLDGNPCLCSRGYGGVRCIRNEYGEAYLEFLGLGGVRRNLPKEAWKGGGFFGFEQRFDSHGNNVWKMHFDENYEYVVYNNGEECGHLDILDETGRKIARLHLGTDGKPYKSARGEWGWHLPTDSDSQAKGQKRQSITDEKLAEKLFAQGMAAIVAPRNRFVEEWKKVRLKKVPKQKEERSSAPRTPPCG